MEKGKSLQLGNLPLNSLLMETKCLHQQFKVEKNSVNTTKKQSLDALDGKKDK